MNVVDSSTTEEQRSSAEKQLSHQEVNIRFLHPNEGGRNHVLSENHSPSGSRTAMHTSILAR